MFIKIIFTLLGFFVTFASSENSNQNKEKEWNILLNWYRERVETEKVTEYNDLYDYESDVTVNDEAFDLSNIRLIDADSEWDWLINQTIESTTTSNVFFFDDYSEDIKRSGGASLAFVFDSTGSMGDELNHVKTGAGKILAALRDHPDAPIYNYIWVPFNDPEIGPVTVTTDPALFQERMSDAIASGGGDCPEMSLGAIKSALNYGLLNSYVYVFTDAPPKDYDLENEVLALVQRKQAQVVFILTGGCIDSEPTHYDVYERIAETSSGQIYKLSTDEVKQVLKYVKVALQPHIVSLLSINKPAPSKTNPDQVEVYVDDSLRQFTVSVTGLNATINVKDPRGININGLPKLENVLNLTNIKVVNVKEPDPGAWSVIINSDSNYMVRSTGLSKINFNHGFSTKETINMKAANYRPLKGARSYILIQTSDVDQFYNMTNLDFVSLSGNILEHLELIPVKENPGLYKAGSFIPPEEFFYVGVSGFGHNGLPIKRITSTAISAQLPEKPIITMKEKASGMINSEGLINCYIESVVPFTVQWYKNGVFLGEEQNCSETCKVIFPFDKFTMDSEGNYTCSAKNLAGNESKSLYLTIIDDAPLVSVESPMIASLGQEVYLQCSVQSRTQYTVKWARLVTRNHNSEISHASRIGVKQRGDTLVIESVNEEDEGWYICIARNNGGESHGRVHLVINEPLIVYVQPKFYNFKEGDSIKISCSASGKPRSTLEWVKNSEPVKDPYISIEETKRTLNLIIDYLYEKHAGLYTCNAENSIESASASVELFFEKEPKIKAKENSLFMKMDSEVVMKCEGSGSPNPTIKWFKDGKKIIDISRFKISEDTLTITSSNISDSGEYACVAENRLGTAIDTIGLIVGSSPVFTKKIRDKNIQINRTTIIPCLVSGIPNPEITWKKSDGTDFDKTRTFILPSGSLKIIRTKYEDGGSYICTAENIFGKVSNEVLVTVIGIEKPMQDKNVKATEFTAVSGKELILSCGILLGNPKANVKWYKKGTEIRPGEDFIIKNSGELIIVKPTIENGGSYECSAANVAGNASRQFNVLFTETPKINASENETLIGKLGGLLIIPCPVQGFPQPIVKWEKNGLPLSVSPKISQDERGNLIIKNLSKENAGNYVCIASNAIGTASKSTNVFIQVPPYFVDEAQEFPVNVVEGHIVVLNCNVNGDPEPFIQWFKNGEPFYFNEEQPKILRFLASIDDTGVFKCVVTNEAGSAIREFNVNTLVPPKILDHSNEESIKAKAGFPVTLTCNVIGVPKPIILWQRNGMYLTKNTSDLIISSSGSLTMKNVTKDSAGAYMCDAENLGGIMQKTFYLQVHYPPVILESINESYIISLQEGEGYSLVCSVDGYPKPSVLWRKNGIPISKHEKDMIILEDNTLVLFQVNTETAGTYKCEVFNSEGSTYKEYEISVIMTPSLSMDSYPIKLEVNEGDSITLTCPTRNSTVPPKIQWVKNDEQLDYRSQERADEARIKLTSDQTTLTIIEAHPSDRGNYSCTATDIAGRTDAKFFVDVLLTPHFEEFNHVAHRTILTGGEVVLNCSVSGNPQPKILWRKENSSITNENTPGVSVSLDNQHLVIANGKVNHSGTYICLAANKVNTKEREFYVTVLEPPRIKGLLQETVSIMKGSDVILECKSSGIPRPTFSWIKQVETNKIKLNNTKDHLQIANASCTIGGIYTCEVTNSVGKISKHFEVIVYESPEIEEKEHIDEVNGIVGNNITLKCKTSGQPKPNVEWLKNGLILNRFKRYFKFYENYNDNLASLLLSNVSENDSGIYTIIAFNKAGVVEKKFNVHVLVPMKSLTNHESHKRNIAVIHSLPIKLGCPIVEDSTTKISWFLNEINTNNLEHNKNVLIYGKDLWIMKPFSQQSGIYICSIIDMNISSVYSFNVTVVASEPQFRNANGRELRELIVNDTLTLKCNVSGSENIEYYWFYSSNLLKNSTSTIITENGKTLVIPKVQINQTGIYSCSALSETGSAELFFYIQVYEIFQRNEEPLIEQLKSVRLNNPFTLYCEITENLPVKISWYKNDTLLKYQRNSSFYNSNNIYLSFPGKPEDSGNYKCIAENLRGTKERKFKVEIIVPGEWTDWSSWSECSTTCGSGERVRRRSCSTNNVNSDSRIKIDYKNCIGPDVEKKKCHNKCNGSYWSSWGKWSSCSQTCGRGFRRRFRTCMHSEFNNEEKYCIGNGSEKESCIEKECSYIGSWSAWSEWSSCSHPCDGVTLRVRKSIFLEFPNGGKDSSEWAGQLKVCNTNECQDGKLSSWSKWSPCSVTCGEGTRNRFRKCIKIKGNEICKGSKFQRKKCFKHNCQGQTLLPSDNLYQKTRLKASSKEIKSEVETGKRNERQILLSKNYNPKSTLIPFFETPVQGNTTFYERERNLKNKNSLENENNYTELKIQYPIEGESLEGNQKGDDVDSKRRFKVEIEVIGEAPQIKPQSVIVIEEGVKSLILPERDKLHSFTQNRLTVENSSILSSIQEPNQNNLVKKIKPYFIEKLTLTNFSKFFINETQKVIYTASAIVEKKLKDNNCPPGFINNYDFQHCEDIDECKNAKEYICRRGEECKNTFGSYKCICQRGYILKDENCLDVNECSQDYNLCSHFCYNTPGSYICSCPYGFYLSPDRRRCLEIPPVFTYQEYENVQNLTTLYPIYGKKKYQEWKVDKKFSCLPGYYFLDGHCKDYNECENLPNICDVDETCINLLGSFQCISIPCPIGFQRNLTNRHCIRICSNHNKCQRGAQITESLIFHSVTLKYSNVIALDRIVNQPQYNIFKVKYKVTQSNKLFKVNLSKGRAFLYPTRKLNRNTLYRVKVEAFFYSFVTLLMHFIEYNIFIVVL